MLLDGVIISSIKTQKSWRDAVDHPAVVLFDQVEGARRARVTYYHVDHHDGLGRVGNLGAGLDDKAVEVTLNLEQHARTTGRQGSL